MTAPSRPAGLFTIGYSNHEIEEFVALLREHEIEAIADVRSSPYSRFTPSTTGNRSPTHCAASAFGMHFSGGNSAHGATSRSATWRGRPATT